MSEKVFYSQKTGQAEVVPLNLLLVVDDKSPDGTTGMKESHRLHNDSRLRKSKKSSVTIIYDNVNFKVSGEDEEPYELVENPYSKTNAFFKRGAYEKKGTVEISKKEFEQISMQ